MYIKNSGLEYMSLIGSQVDEIQVQKVQHLLRKCSYNRNVNMKYSSYRLKHIFERYFHTYISNGAFIQAAVIEGVIIRKSPPNIFINISKKSINEIINHTI